MQQNPINAHYRQAKGMPTGDTKASSIHFFYKFDIDQLHIRPYNIGTNHIDQLLEKHAIKGTVKKRMQETPIIIKASFINEEVATKTKAELERICDYFFGPVELFAVMDSQEFYSYCGKFESRY